MVFQPQPLVSVITPVYNGAKYLAECIESVLAQTYKNWEYVIVNNCSSDNSLQIAQEYQKRDHRIRIHNNREHVGVIQNHNIAFRQMSRESQYCKVLQADDWLFPDCIDQMVNVAEPNPNVGIVGSYNLCHKWVKCDGLPYPSTVVSGRDICRQTLLGLVYPFLSPTSLLVRSGIIRARQSFYNESHIYADVEASYEVLRHFDFGFVHQILVYIRRHDESMSSSFARPLNSFILGELYYLTQFGPTYLTPEEHRKQSRKAWGNYYGFLARSLLRFRERKFWEYHRSELKKMGYPFSWIKLGRALALNGFDLLFNPKRSTEIAIRKLVEFGQVRYKRHQTTCDN